MEMENQQLTVETLADTTLTMWSRLTPPVVACGDGRPPIQCDGRARHLWAVLPPKPSRSGPSGDKHQTNPNQGPLYKTPNQYSSKMSRS